MADPTTDQKRRERWAETRLQCDPVTGEPGYQELILPHDLVEAMEAEAEHTTAEIERLRAALQHIATGGVAGPPAMTFADRILAGDSIEDAHAAAKDKP